MSKDKSARLGGARRLKAPGAATFQFDRVAHRDVAVTSRAIIEKKIKERSVAFDSQSPESKCAEHGLSVQHAAAMAAPQIFRTDPG